MSAIDAGAANEVIGVIPAAGRATRIAPLPCSKELFPIGFRSQAEVGSRPKVVSQYLLEKMKRAGISKAYFVIRPEKWDIPGYYGDGSMLDMHLGYLMMGLPYGVPFTLDQAYPFVRHATVAFGFPDILFDSEDGFVRLLDRQRTSGADITLGLCPAVPFSKYDRVDFTGDGAVREIMPTPSDGRLPYSWAIAVWSPDFTQFLHSYVRDKTMEAQSLELTAGHAFQASIRAGLRVEALILSETPYLDIGTPDDLRKAIRQGI